MANVVTKESLGVDGVRGSRGHIAVRYSALASLIGEQTISGDVARVCVPGGLDHGMVFVRSSQGESMVVGSSFRMDGGGRSRHHDESGFLGKHDYERWFALGFANFGRADGLHLGLRGSKLSQFESLDNEFCCGCARGILLFRCSPCKRSIIRPMAFKYPNAPFGDHYGSDTFSRRSLFDGTSADVAHRYRLVLTNTGLVFRHCVRSRRSSMDQDTARISYLCFGFGDHHYFDEAL